MSCWRVLELSEQPHGQQIPQLLIKPGFNKDSYTIYLTCLSNIWSEELDPAGIVDRASEEQSPIDVSKQDTAQLAILLKNVKKSLERSDDTTCRITRNDVDCITLHTTITLPAPLESLTWRFYLKKRTSTTLKNELILPLLISSHIQHQRMTNLITTIQEKDKAITRLLDQFDSSNLDLAAAFPAIGGLKSGRKHVKREQAAKHIPALQPFREEAFMDTTGQLPDPNVDTLELFQEALSECTPGLPTQLESDDTDSNWWGGLPAQLSSIKHAPKVKSRQTTTAPEPTTKNGESSGDETEDEFETHENFKTRITPSKPNTIPERIIRPPQKTQPEIEGDSTEDDEDLDAPIKTKSQSSIKQSQSQSRNKSPTIEEQSDRTRASPPATKKVKGFRIGGKSKNITAKSPSPKRNTGASATEVADPIPLPKNRLSPVPSQADVTPKKSKKVFKIGGKGKAAQAGSSQVDTASPPVQRTRATQSPTAEPPSSPPRPAPIKEESPILEEAREETAEEKAERRRAELKRKTEEAAKKQAQNKKKRRF